MSILAAELIADLAVKLLNKQTGDADAATEGELGSFLEKLLEGKKLDLGGIASKSDITDAVVNKALETLKKLKAKSGTTRTGLFGRGILGSILKSFDSPFAHHERPKSSLGNTAGEGASPSGIHALRYYVERLPVIPGEDTLQLLTIAWESWFEKCDIDIKETGNRANANVIVNVKPLNGEPASVLAIADVGPPDGKQLELTFDERKEGSWTKHKFLATAAHEMGHILGLDHILNVNDQLMNELLHDNIESPQDSDVAAVVKIWGAV